MLVLAESKKYVPFFFKTDVVVTLIVFVCLVPEAFSFFFVALSSMMKV